ncbi:MAG: amino acid ABC transporter substrate-binding protein [Betaproteobacteria bacterium]|nr:amino acid ABC transporter substrate-binding protein [Betaproteobacteria bacterium]
MGSPESDTCGRRAGLRARAVAWLLAAAFSAVAVPAAAASATLDRIKSGGVVRFAYREAAAPFSFKDGDRVRGYAVELCERVAESIRARLGLARLDVQWRGVDAAARLEAVAKGEVDAECGTTTITLGRMEQVDFSVPFYVDGGSVLVRAEAKIARLAGLKGRRVAAIPGTTTERALTTQLTAIGAPATLVPVASIAEGMAALAAGKVDGVAGDRIVLTWQRARAAKPVSYAFVGDDFSYEPYAIVVRRDDPDFRLAVNRALVALYRSGEIDAIFHRWFGGLGAPGPLLHAMFYLQQYQD